MLTRQDYISAIEKISRAKNILEKKAFGGTQAASLLVPGGLGYQVGRYIGHNKQASSEPDYKIDSHKQALKDHDKNRSDSRETLKGMFDNAKGEADTKLINKLWQKGPKETSNALLKIAFYNGLTTSGISKTASPNYLQVAYLSFQRELEKIASLADTLTQGMRSSVIKKPGEFLAGHAANIGSQVNKATSLVHKPMPGMKPPGLALTH